MGKGEEEEGRKGGGEEEERERRNCSHMDAVLNFETKTDCFPEEVCQLPLTARILLEVAYHSPEAFLVLSAAPLVCDLWHTQCVFAPS